MANVRYLLWNEIAWTYAMERYLAGYGHRGKHMWREAISPIRVRKEGGFLAQRAICCYKCGALKP